MITQITIKTKPCVYFKCRQKVVLQLTWTIGKEEKKKREGLGKAKQGAQTQFPTGGMALKTGTYLKNLISNTPCLFLISPPPSLPTSTLHSHHQFIIIILLYRIKYPIMPNYWLVHLLFALPLSTWHLSSLDIYEHIQPNKRNQCVHAPYFLHQLASKLAIGNKITKR